MEELKEHLLWLAEQTDRESERLDRLLRKLLNSNYSVADKASIKEMTEEMFRIRSYRVEEIQELAKDNPPAAAKLYLAAVNLSQAKSIKEELCEVAAMPTALGQAPAIYLCSWAEILACLGLTKDEKNRVQNLVDKFDGPIISTGQGGQPFVAKYKLLEWWNGLGQLVLEKSQRMEDKEATVAERHNFGRKGTAAPAIGGGIKGRQPKENITKHQKT